jgi:Flp pilus assembly pilin Flp
MSVVSVGVMVVKRLVSCFMNRSPHNDFDREDVEPMDLLKRFIAADSGAETIEYALVLGLLAIAAVATMGALGTQVSAFWTYLGTQIPTS